MQLGQLVAKGIKPLLIALAATLTLPATAGSFQVSPITTVVSHGRPVGVITVRNEANEPVSIRVLGYRWTQENGVDVHTATTDLIASPPIFTIPAKGSQLIRVGLPKVNTDGEAAYRVVLEEIPKLSSGEGIRVSLRLNLPFYKQPKMKGAADTKWTALIGKSGAIQLRGTNLGSLHEQVNRVELVQSGKRTILVNTPGAVLANSTKVWEATSQAEVKAGTTINLVVVTPIGEEKVQANVQDLP